MGVESHSQMLPEIASSGNAIAGDKVFYPALDGLRAAAAFAVFFYHYFAGSHVPPSLKWGWAGVDAFFVLSGFLITGILFDTRRQLHRLRNFYIRRSLRIFPLYYGVLAILVVSTPLVHWVWHRSMFYWPLYLGNYAGNLLPSDNMHGELFSRTLGHPVVLSHFWSLCVEEQFYLFWPFVVFSISDRVRLRNLCLTVVVLAPIVRLVVSHFLSAGMQDARLLFFATPFRVDGLLLGGAVALMLRGPEADRVQRSALPVFCGASLLLGLSWLFAVVVLHQPVGVGVAPPWIETVGFTWIDLIVVAILLFALRPGNPVYRVFSIPALRRVGQVSYGFYVFHMIPYEFYVAAATELCGRRANLVGPATGAIAFLGTLGLAFLSYRFYETRFLRLKDRWTT